LALADSTANHRPLVPTDRAEHLFEEARSDPLEQEAPAGRAQVQQCLRADRLPLDRRVTEALVRERPGGAGHHALAARHAGRRAHELARVEGDHRRVALAGAADDVVVRDVGAGTHAAVAHDAGRVVDGDVRVRIVVDRPGCDRRPLGRPGLVAVGPGSELPGLRLQLAVLGLLLPGTGRRVVRHQQLDERTPGLLHLLGVRLHVYVRARGWLELAPP